LGDDVETLEKNMKATIVNVNPKRTESKKKDDKGNRLKGSNDDESGSDEKCDKEPDHSHSKINKEDLKEIDIIKILRKDPDIEFRIAEKGKWYFD
jgi:hypothetical protein